MQADFENRRLGHSTANGSLCAGPGSEGAPGITNVAYRRSPRRRVFLILFKPTGYDEVLTRHVAVGLWCAANSPETLGRIDILRKHG
jgi:hypothetical protein